MIQLSILAAVLLWATVAGAVTRYADNTLSGNCTSGNYSIANRSCTGSDGDAYNTPAGVIAPTGPGDIIMVRAGTWARQWDFQVPGKSGTASGYITMRGYPGERPVIQYDDSAGTGPGYGPIKARGSRGYFLFENLVVDGALSRRSSNWAIRDGNHHFILRNVEIKNFYGSGLLLTSASDVLIVDCSIHDQRFTTESSNHYGIYVAGNTANITIEKNRIYNNTGAGIHGYPGPVTGLTIRNNRIYANGNNPLTAPAAGGIILYESTVAGSTYANVQIYHNLIYKNGLSGVGDGPDGIEINGADNVKIWNNVIHQNKGYGINLHNGTTTPVNTVVQNNIITANTVGQLRDAGSGTTKTFNACLVTDSCGTSKVALASNTEPFANAADDDYRLKQGTNPARNAGTAVTLPTPAVGARDIGAFEQGAMATNPAVVGSMIEAPTDIPVAPLTPTTGITGVTIACVGCTGSPVASSVTLKPGTAGVLQISVSGISSPGTCTISLGATNASDSGFVGPSTDGFSQGLNSASGVAVSGTCANTSGVGDGGGGGLWSELLLEEGSGTVANDSSGLAHHGTVSSGVTWVSGGDGGVTIPADATYRHVDTGYGAGVNPDSQSFAQCAYVVLDQSAGQTVVGSSTNGTNQRMYYGVYTAGGDPQWGIGVQNSAFTTGSEFPATSRPTFVCILSDAATNTVTLRVDNVNGTRAGQSIKTFTPFLLANSLRVGNDGTFPNNNGGFTVYGIWTWDTIPSEAEFTAVYESLAPVGIPLACHEQKTHKWELLHTDGTNPIGVGTVGQEIEVPDGGGVALNIQIDCTTTAGAPLAFRFFYSADGGTTYLEIPATLGAGGVAMLGTNTTPNLNVGATTGRITGALTPIPGVTLSVSNVSPTVTMTTGSSHEIRLLLKFGTGLVGQTRRIVARQDNGLDLANGYAIGPAIIRLVNPYSSAVFQ
jgi:hypothetical protein